MLAGYRISDNPGLNTVFGKPTILGADKTRLVEVLNMWSTLDPEWSVSQCQCGWRSWINTRLLWCFAIEIWRFFSLCLWLWATPSRCLWLCGRSDYRLCRILQTLKWQTVKKKNKKKKNLLSIYTPVSVLELWGSRSCMQVKRRSPNDDICRRLTDCHLVKAPQTYFCLVFFKSLIFM